nr:VOC family protein [Aurantimonas sp. CSK15Z-1]
MVTLASDDLERSAGFYAALGWVRTPAGNDTVIFMQGEGIVLSIFGRDDFVKDVGVSFEGGCPFPSIALALNLASEADVDRLFDAAVAAGGAPVKRPEPTFWGGYSGYVSDLDGHLWELAHNPFFPLDERGHLDLLTPASGSDA